MGKSEDQGTLEQGMAEALESIMAHFDSALCYWNSFVNSKFHEKLDLAAKVSQVSESQWCIALKAMDEFGLFYIEYEPSTAKAYYLMFNYEPRDDRMRYLGMYQPAGDSSLVAKLFLGIMVSAITYPDKTGFLPEESGKVRKLWKRIYQR